MGPEEFAASMRAAFAEAAAAAGRVTWTLEAGAEAVELRFAGEALARRLLPALPRARPGGRPGPGPVLEVWDSASTGVARPPLPWGPGEMRVRGDVVGFNDDRFGTLWATDDPTGPAARETLSVHDAATRAGTFWAPSAAHLSWWERAAPLRPLLRWALAGPGRTFVHGAAVGREGRGLLLAGAGGAGKTSTTLAAVLAGAQTAGDDYVVLEVGGEPLAHALYGGAKVEAATLDLLPELRPAVRAGPREAGEKAVVDVAGAWPERWVELLALTGIVVPVLAPGAATRAVPVPGGTALLALAPSTAGQLPGDRRALATMAALARAVPAWRLEIGGGPRAAAETLLSLLDRERA